MHICKAGEGKPYQAPAHYGQWGSQYFKGEGTSRLTVSISHFLPNGGAEMKAVPERTELIYYVLSGSIMIQDKRGDHILHAGDLVHFGAGDERAVKVNGQVPASLLVVIAAPT